MAILKKFTIPYTQTPNEIINNKCLTLKAKGLWTYLNSKPETWGFSVKGTTSQQKDGRDSITSGMKELEENGYLRRIPKQNNDGKWDGYDYHLYDQPFSEIHVDGKSVSGEPVEHSNKDLSKKEASKIEQNSTLFSSQPIQPVSKEILKYLNEKKPSKIDFQMTKSNLGFIEARIKEGFKVYQFKDVIDFKIKEWKDVEKMKKFIRPATLFGTKFNQYLVEASEKIQDGSANFEFTPTQKVDLL